MSEAFPALHQNCQSLEENHAFMDFKITLEKWEGHPNGALVEENVSKRQTDEGIQGTFVKHQLLTKTNCLPTSGNAPFC